MICCCKLHSPNARYDRLLNDQSLSFLLNLPRIDPVMPYYSEFTDRAMHTVFHVIEQTYDILSARGIPRADKKHRTDRAVRYYLTMQTPVSVARSCAPLDVTMGRGDDKAVLHLFPGLLSVLLRPVSRGALVASDRLRVDDDRG